MHIPMPPKWFNPHGMKMFLKSRVQLLTVSQEYQIVVGSQAARIHVIKALDQRNYRISWHITFSSSNHAGGEIALSEEDLEAAFSINFIGVKPLFAESFGADDGLQGHFIRQGQFLNIPMPGTGADGDPNISIFVSDEIREAVRELIAYQR